MSEFLSLHSILSSLNTPLEEIHFWSILYGLIDHGGEDNLSDCLKSPVNETGKFLFTWNDILIWSNGYVQIKCSGIFFPFI